MKHLRRNKLLVLLMVFVAVISGCSSKNQSTQIMLQEENVIKHLDYITAPELEGRLIGTEGNQKVANYVEDYFRNIGLLGYDEKNYKRKFTALQPQLEKPLFQVIDGDGKVIKTYEYLENYRIPFHDLSLGGSFRGKTRHITDHRELLHTDNRFEGLALLIDYKDPEMKPLNRNELQIDERIRNEQAQVVIYPDNQPVDQYNIRLGIKNATLPENGLTKVAVEGDIYQELIDFYRKGYGIEVEVPLTFTSVDTVNIMGVIPGKKPETDRNIIIATSLDGLGKDPNGYIYPSASDNASSLAVLLELAREMKEKNIQLDSNVIFIVFNGKHTGNVGAESYFADALTEPERTQVIFLDELGAEKDKSLLVATWQNPNSDRKRSLSMVNRIALLGEEEGIDLTTNSRYGRSEYMSFRSRGIVATVLTRGGTQYKGTPQDTMDSINIEGLIEDGQLVLNYLKDYGNINIMTEIMIMIRSGWWAILLLLLIILMKIYYSRREETTINPQIKRILEYPIITITLLLVLFYMVLSLQTWFIEMDQGGLVETQVKVTVGNLAHNQMENLFAMFVMGFWYTVILGLIGGIGLIIMRVKSKMSNTLYIFILTIFWAILFISPISNQYHQKAAVLIPEILSPSNPTIFIPIGLALISFIITWVYQKEKEFWFKEPIKKVEVLIVFMVITLLISTYIYAPYLSAKEIQELRNAGRRPFF